MYLLSVFALLFFLAVSDGTHKFRSDYTYHSSVDGWLKLHAIPSTWSEARLWCHYEGSVLASPLTHEMMTAMKQQIGSNHISPFTGISANYTDGAYFSVEGVPLSKIPVQWVMGQPDNKDDQEKCIAIQRNDDHGGYYELADVRCNQPRPFFCFKKNSQQMPEMNECGTIDHEYSLDSRTGHCYKLHRVGLTWHRAFMACTAEGGYLAVINSDKEAQVLRDLIAKHPKSTYMAMYTEWIGVGFRDWTDKGTQWMTIHGQTLKEAGYEKWIPGNPNSASSLDWPWVEEHCGIVSRSAELGDLHCDYTIPFICEMEPGPTIEDGPEYDIDIRLPN